MWATVFGKGIRMKRKKSLTLIRGAMICSAVFWRAMSLGAAESNNRPDAPIVITNLVGVWTNAESVLTISSVDANSAVIAGEYRTRLALSRGVRPITGWLHTRGVGEGFTNR